MTRSSKIEYLIKNLSDNMLKRIKIESTEQSDIHKMISVPPRRVEVNKNTSLIKNVKTKSDIVVKPISILAFHVATDGNSSIRYEGIFS